VLSRVPVRWRLTIGYTLAMAVVLAALGAVVFVRVGDTLRGSLDQTLRAQAAESARDLSGQLRDPDESGRATVVQVLDAHGKLVRSAPAGLGAIVSGANASAHGSDRLLTVEPESVLGGERWRVLLRPVAGRTLVVARSLETVEEAERNILHVLLLVAPLGLLVAAAGGYVLSAAALRPVELMRRRAAAVSAQTPGTRLPVPPSRDELRQLALTLNGMLARLEAGLAHERRFVADASHELRTPLTLLKTELELALRRPRSAEELRAAIESAAEDTDRLVQLADDLLVIARSEQGALQLRRDPIDVGELAARMAERFAPRAAELGRQVVVDVPAGTWVEGDRLRLEQALGNLVDNALRHGAGPVRLSAAAVDGSVELHVSDAGAGFPAGFAERAFERFSRADDARSSGGSGLGLAIVEAIAHAHGGSAGIGAANGRGADVWLRLPAHRPLIAAS
jgi:signal transduction histidine kinase